MKFNERLKLLRQAEGYTQKQIAAILEIDPTNYQRYEYGKVEPNYKILNRICNLFPEYISWIMTGKNEFKHPGK